MSSRLRQWGSNSTQKWVAIATLMTAIMAIAGLLLKPAPTPQAEEVSVADNQTQTQATAAARDVQRQEQVRQIRSENYDLGRFPVSDRHESHWRNILWTTGVVQPQAGFVAESLDQILGMTLLSGLSDAQMRTIDAATKVATQLYLSDSKRYSQIGQRFLQMAERSPDAEWTAVALSGLLKGRMAQTDLNQLAARVQKRFPKWKSNVYLYTTLAEIALARQPEALPPLKDLLGWTIAPRQLHAYVLCRPNRDILCQMVLKDRDGKFVRSEGQIWSVPLLLRSIHHLSWNFVRGATPQGVYRVEGIVPQPDDEFFRAYGQFSLVKLFVPFESGVKQFLPGKAGSFQGDLSTYQSLLPPSWRRYFPIQQSYWAGKAGRSLFRVHGTGESPNFFSGKANNPDAYNWNPTIGCLSALEIYNQKGTLLQADMPKILHAFRMVGGNNFAGYLIVVDVPGDEKPVSAQEIATVLRSQPSATKQSDAKPSGAKSSGDRASTQSSTATKLVSVQPIQPVETTTTAPAAIVIHPEQLKSSDAATPKPANSEPTQPEPQRSPDEQTSAPIAY